MKIGFANDIENNIFCLFYELRAYQSRTWYFILLLLQLQHWEVQFNNGYFRNICKYNFFNYSLYVLYMHSIIYSNNEYPSCLHSFYCFRKRCKFYYIMAITQLYLYMNRHSSSKALSLVGVAIKTDVLDHAPRTLYFIAWTFYPVILLSVRISFLLSPCTTLSYSLFSKGEAANKEGTVCSKGRTN